MPEVLDFLNHNSFLNILDGLLRIAGIENLFLPFLVLQDAFNDTCNRVMVIEDGDRDGGMKTTHGAPACSKGNYNPP